MRLPLVLAALALAAIATGVVLSVRGGPAPSPSTLRTTYADPGRRGVLQPAPGEPLLDRTELAPRSAAVRQLAVFAQLTDAHVTDEESPARLEMLDRLGPPFTSAFRPQEALTGQVLAAAVASVNELHPNAVVVTGDLIDDDQQNELDEAVAILRGGRVDPGSGGPGYQGVQAAANPDAYYYRPDVDPPRHPGLLFEAEQPFVSPGLDAPWYPALGNHDVLVQGNLRATAETDAIAIGTRKPVALDQAALALVRRGEVSAGAIDALLARGVPGPSIRVTADPRRRELAAPEVLRWLRRASGHGGSGPLLDYSFRLGPGVRGIVLDTIRRDEGSSGIVRPSQVAWLRAQLRAAGSNWVVVFTHTPLLSASGGDAALALLDDDPHVVAAVNGDTHRNSIVPRRAGAHGYWLIATSSLVDYPQQARAFRLLATRDGGVVLQTWMLDTDPRNRLAAISRQLAYLDFQGGRPQGFAGTRVDRNASLYVAK